MAANHKKTLVIELGIGCNNRCLFCYQRGYREVPGYPKWLSADEVRARLRWGIANGHDEASFTGGEPTIRPDFLDLVRYAREIGYRRVAVTTNGWRLAQPDFFEAAVRAGLTSMGVSIHGPDSETHEGLTGRPGSFARAIQAIRNAVRTRGSSHLVRLNTFTLVNRRNLHRIRELAILLHHLGVRLLVLQPVILSKSNFEQAAGLMVSLSETVQAVREVAQEGMARGFRTKLFNLPPCLFQDVLGGLELDHYPRATFREHDDASPGSRSLGDEVGSVRLEACARCVLRPGCAGIPASLLPEDEIAVRIEEALDALNPGLRRQVWIAGTDLLRPGGVYRVVRKARLCGFEDVRVTHGGASLGGRAFMTAAVQAGASEVILVHHGVDSASADRILSHAGNDRFLVQALSQAVQEVRRTETRAGVLVTPDRRGLEFLKTIEDFTDIGALELHLREPFRANGFGHALTEWRRFLAGLQALAVRPRRVVVDVPWPRIHEVPSLLALAGSARGRVRFDLTGFVLTTPFLDPRYAVLNWSEPRIGGRRVDLRVSKNDTIFVRSLRVLPLTEAMIQQSRLPR